MMFFIYYVLVVFILFRDCFTSFAMTKSTIIDMSLISILFNQIRLEWDAINQQDDPISYRLCAWVRILFITSLEWGL